MKPSALHKTRRAMSLTSKYTEADKAGANVYKFGLSNSDHIFESPAASKQAGKHTLRTAVHAAVRKGQNLSSQQQSSGGGIDSERVAPDHNGRLHYAGITSRVRNGRNKPAIHSNVTGSQYTTSENLVLR